MSGLRPNGKPMRALRVLAAKSDEANPLTEGDVWRLCKADDFDCTTWHAPLATLVKRGLAKRTGRPGGYQWWITDEGKAALEPVAS